MGVPNIEGVYAMKIETNTTDRKALVQAIAEELHSEAHYLGMPTCAYEVGSFIVDRDGNIVGEDFAPLLPFLQRNGYVADLKADAQTITIPAPDITVEQLRNLSFILYSRQHILNLMTGAETIRIPAELVEALKEALPATREDFTMLLDSYKEQGLTGFDFRAGEFSLVFPFYENEPLKWTAFAGLQGRILLAAREATRVFPELMKPEEEAEKYTAHMWLQRLGYKGPEMKEQRSILLKHLHGYCAFSNGTKMQSHKDKYAALRRERREAERPADEPEKDA